MKIRAKISYHAFIKKDTVQEHIVKQIMKSYVQLTKCGAIQPVMVHSEKVETLLKQMLDGSIKHVLLHLVDYNTDSVVIARKQLLEDNTQYSSDLLRKVIKGMQVRLTLKELEMIKDVKNKQLEEINKNDNDKKLKNFK